MGDANWWMLVASGSGNFHGWAKSVGVPLMENIHVDPHTTDILTAIEPLLKQSLNLRFSSSCDQDE